MMDAIPDNAGAKLRPIFYWRLWLLNAVLVSAGVLFLLATQYGSFEFFGKAVLMALLPFIPIMVLVGGAGSTIFALTKVLIEKRGLKISAALALLVGPGLIVTALLALLGTSRSSSRWLNYVCVGNAPVSASQVRVTGYSTFLHEEWLAVFNVNQKDFETMAAAVKMAPVDNFEFQKRLGQSSFKTTKLFQSLPPLTNAVCCQRTFKAKAEHERGSVDAVFDAATSTAVVLREYRD